MGRHRKFFKKNHFWKLKKKNEKMSNTKNKRLQSNTISPLLVEMVVAVVHNRLPFGVFQEVHFQNQILQRKKHHLLNQSKRPKEFKKKRQFSQFHSINLPNLKRKRNQFFLSMISANLNLPRY